MFEILTRLPTDPILGLLNQYRDDTNPAKVDLGVGVYKDETGHTPILSCVKQAEQQRLTEETSKVYIGPAGAMPFNKLMTELAFGHNHPALLADRIRTVSTPGEPGHSKLQPILFSAVSLALLSGSAIRLGPTTAAYLKQLASRSKPTLITTMTTSASSLMPCAKRWRRRQRRM